jgi:hypothetical protein
VPAAGPPSAAVELRDEAGPGPEIHVPDTTSALRFNLRHAAVALVIGGLVGALLAMAVGGRQETYESRAVLAIDQPLAIAASDSGGIVEKLGRLRGKYAGLVRTNVIAEPVAERTGQPLATVRGDLSAYADDTSLLLAVAAHSTNPAMARTLAAAAAEEIVGYADAEQQRYSIPKAQRFVFEVVVPAGSARSVTPERSRQLRVGALGLVVGGFLVYGALELLAAERRT